MDSLQAYLIEQAALCRERAVVLTADDRRDEAVFEKIRANVFEIFLSVWNAAQDQTEPMTFFRRQLTVIPAHWEASQEKAKAHSDEARAHTEAVKLDAVRAIRQEVEA